MPTVKLILEYDGTNYAGWQRQPDQPTIQEAVESALYLLTQSHASVIAAGRTDAGVHALGQVASFRINKAWTAAEWIRGFNARLPKDIAVRSAAIMPDEFHARYAARGKLYEYRIVNRPERPAVARTYSWHIGPFLKIEPMIQAGNALIGSHDFSSFEGTLTDNEDPMCNIQQLTVTRQDDRLNIHIYADRFLKHMVRNIVGTLVEIGHGKRSVMNISEILAARDRRRAGRTAPPQGLFLVKVDYATIS
ncbi:tRNA pseudouridine synthase A [Nitrospira sp. KM1]|uniref:tRNA pseudouridine(38-40) synthase TruA n=1 Tax=Nitrospira sp. KM1 TaxID=1936990 RepID=UPI0013A7505A|nr:tRNA pseudouridine(38-40) synthase TruA [Nitrospira sp. KM1]BCA54184.1 tRNA pseudouridine synthase A [Nitrospira sp. KM1]